MTQTPHARLMKHMAQFESVGMLHAHHQRKLQRTIWTLVLCSVLWLLAQLVLRMGLPKDYTPYAPALSWIERHFWDPTPVFNGLLHAGWIHTFQAALCLIIVMSLLRTVRAHMTLPKRLEDARRAREAMNEQTLRKLYDDAVRLNMYKDQNTRDGLEGGLWITKVMRNVSITCVIMCVMVLLSMKDVTQNITDVPHWDRAIAQGLLGQFGLICFVLAAFGTISIPFYGLLKLSEVQNRRFESIAREDMLVLQREVMGKQIQGGLSRAETSQGGELSMDQEGGVTITSQKES